MKPIDGRDTGEIYPTGLVNYVEPLAIEAIKAGGESVDDAVSWLVNVHYRTALKATGKYLRHLDPGAIDAEMDYCALKTALKYNPKVGTFAAYYIATLKNRLYDITFKKIHKTNKRISNIDILLMAEKNIKNIFDHNKIILIKKKSFSDYSGTKRVVRFNKSDLDVLTGEEKNLLALVSQVWCTNKVIAQRMGISESKVSMLWQRINRKLYPIYRKRRAEQFDWTWGGTFAAHEEANMEAAAAEYTADMKSGTGGWSIERAYFAGLDDDKDFNTSIHIQNRFINKRMDQGEK